MILLRTPRRLCSCGCQERKISKGKLLWQTGITLVLLVAYLTTIGISAHAFFSYHLYSRGNIISAARFAVTVSAEDESGVMPTIVSTDSITHTLTLSPQKLYAVTLRTEGTAQTGFCIITASNSENRYHTQLLQEHDDEGGFVFYLSVTEETQVDIVAHWGDVANYPLCASDHAREIGCIQAGESVLFTVTTPTPSSSNAPIVVDSEKVEVDSGSQKSGE